MKRLWKYIVIDHPDGFLQIPLIFPEQLQHSFVATLGRGGKAVSAGFCEIDVAKGTVRVWGESEGLRLKCRPDADEKLMRICFVGPLKADPLRGREDPPRL
jgi:hypothetical protein